MSVGARIDQLIEEAGTTVVYTRVTPGAFNATTGKTATPTTVNYPLKATIRAYKPHEIRGLVQDGDQRVTIPGAAGLPFTPDKNDLLYIDSKRYNILTVAPVYNREELIAHRLVVRGGTGG